MNKYRPHILVVPEDDANRQLANGFILHHAIDSRAVQIMPPARGWTHALSMLKEEYLKYLCNYESAHVILLIDFDDVDNRRTVCEQIVPDNMKGRVFFVGSKVEPEAVKREVHISLEAIGTQLAEECYQGNYNLWTSTHFGHNDAERGRLSEVVRPILFPID